MAIRKRQVNSFAGDKLGPPCHRTAFRIPRQDESALEGSITRDASALTIKIRTVALSHDKESRLRSFVQQLLLDPE